MNIEIHDIDMKKNNFNLHFLFSNLIVFIIMPFPVLADSLGTHCWQQEPFSHIICFEVNGKGQYFSLVGENIVDETNYPIDGSALLDKSTGQFRMSFTQNLGGALVFENTVVLDPTTLNGTWSDDGGNEGEFQYLGIGPLDFEKIKTITTRRAKKRKKHCALPN